MGTSRRYEPRDEGVAARLTSSPPRVDAARDTLRPQSRPPLTRTSTEDSARHGSDTQDSCDWQEFLIHLGERRLQTAKMGNQGRPKTAEVSTNSGMRRFLDRVPKPSSRPVQKSTHLRYAAVQHVCICLSYRLADFYSAMNDVLHPITKLANRSTFHNFDQTSRSVSEKNPWSFRKRNSNIKNLSVAIPRVSSPISELETPGAAPGRRPPATTQPKAEHLPSRDGTGVSVNCPVSKIDSQGLQTLESQNAEHVKVVPPRATQSPLVQSTSRDEPGSSRLPSPKSTRETHGRATKSRSVPQIINLHLPRTMPDDEIARKLAEERNRAFHEMLKDFKSTQKELEKNIIQDVLVRSEEDVSATNPLVKTTASASLKRVRTSQDARKQVPQLSLVTAASPRSRASTVSTSVSQPSLHPKTLGGHSTNAGDQIGASQGVGAKIAPSALETFQAMKATIARISAHESYSRSYNAARNFSTNSQDESSSQANRAVHHKIPEKSGRHESRRQRLSPLKMVPADLRHARGSSEQTVRSPNSTGSTKSKYSYF